MRTLLAPTLVALVCALGAGSAAATPGDYDFSFGGTGIVPTRFGDNSDMDTARDVAGQSDGKVVVVGTPAVANDMAWAVARYTAGGALDPTFGQGGAVRDTVVDEGSIPWAVKIQPDGKIVVGGASAVGAAAHFAFVRYLPSGALDPSFDGDGKVSVAVLPADNQERVQGISIAPDGKIVGVGKTNDGVGVVRLNTNGTPDSTFAGDGSLDLPLANADVDDAAVQSDGKVVIPVETGAGGGDHFTIVRLDDQGVPDGSFGTGGTVQLAVGAAARSTAVAIQPDGKILVGGYAEAGGNPTEFAIARLSGDNGSPDMSFDGDGQEMTPISTGFDANGQSVLVQPNGKILLAGVTDYDMSGHSTMGFVRYNTDGALDSTFLGNGVLLAPLPTGWPEAFPSKTTFACDGKILTVGRADLGTPHEQFFTARFLGDPIPCPGLNSPVPLPGPGADVTKPHTRIRGLKRVMRASKLRRFHGTASDNTRVRRVDIALLRTVGKAKAAKSRCLWLRSAGAKFKVMEPRHGKCTQRRWLRARGTKSWSFKLRKRLPPGRYVLFARATDTSGNRETRFSAARHNRVAFRLRKG